MAVLAQLPLGLTEAERTEVLRCRLNACAAAFSRIPSAFNFHRLELAMRAYQEAYYGTYRSKHD